MNWDSPFYHLNPVVKDSFGVVRPVNEAEFYPAQACCFEEENTPAVTKLLELKEIIEAKLLALESGDCDCVCNAGKFAPATDCCDPFGILGVASPLM